jgi:hypothetical protein
MKKKTNINYTLTSHASKKIREIAKSRKTTQRAVIANLLKFGIMTYNSSQKKLVELAATERAKAVSSFGHLREPNTEPVETEVASAACHRS